MAFAGTDRNFYDRYFFNGYAPDGSGFFAVALGIYPHLDIIDAHFNVVRDGVQHCVHASAELGMERMAMAKPPAMAPRPNTATKNRAQTISWTERLSVIIRRAMG